MTWRLSSRTLEREFADLEDVWKAEKGGHAGCGAYQGGSLERAQAWSSRRPIGPTTWRECRNCSTDAFPELEKQLEAEAMAVEKVGRPRCCATMSPKKRWPRVVSKWTGIPVSKMLEGEKEKLLRMEAVVRERVVGQEEAVTAVANAIRRSRAGSLGSASGP